MATTMIRVQEEDKTRLAKFGDASDSIGDCLTRVLDIAEKKCACACEGEPLDFA
jgi:hypothetical protein